jgi:hypothetical protein
VLCDKKVDNYIYCIQISIILMLIEYTTTNNIDDNIRNALLGCNMNKDDFSDIASLVNVNMKSELFKNMYVNDDTINTSSIVYKLTQTKTSNDFSKNIPAKILVKGIRKYFGKMIGNIK